MKCNNCNYELSDNALFCPSCGKEVIKATPEASAPARKPCPHCGTSVPITAKFCKACGKSIDASFKKSCPVCGKELNSDALFCPVCGTGTNNASKPAPSSPYVHSSQAKKSKKWIVIMLLVIAIAAAGGIFAWLYFSSNNASDDDTLPASTTAVSEKTQSEHKSKEAPEEDPEEDSEKSSVSSPSDEAAMQTSDFLFPSDSVYITASDLYGYSQEQVALIRNEIYARRGYVFQTEPYKSYFSSKEWYSPNPYFNESVFNIIEKTNKDFIVEYEKSMGWR